MTVEDVNQLGVRNESCHRQGCRAALNLNASKIYRHKAEIWQWLPRDLSPKWAPILSFWAQIVRNLTATVAILAQELNRGTV